MALKIEPLNRQHNRTNFSCGETSLDNYLQKQAFQDVKKRATNVWILRDDTLQDGAEMNVLAYYTLSAFYIELDVVDDKLAKQLPRYEKLPATLLGRLAVDSGQQGKNLGKLMLLNSLERALIASAQIASMAVVVEAIDSKAQAFYMRHDFKQFNNDPLKLYLPMKYISKMGF